MNSLKNILSEIATLTDKLSKENSNIEEEISTKNQLSKLLNDAEKLQHLQFLSTHECAIKDTEISLYLDNDKHSQKYIIINSSTKDYIGEIIYTNLNPDDTKKYGNIAYYVSNEKRGNNYALKALNLLSDLLYAKGIKSIYIAAKPDNIASIKTIETFGGKISNFSNNTTIVYYCNLNKIKKSINKNPR